MARYEWYSVREQRRNAYVGDSERREKMERQPGPKPKFESIASGHDSEKKTIQKRFKPATHSTMRKDEKTVLFKYND